MASVVNFVILNRPPSGMLSANAPESPEYTYIASAINISLGIVTHPTCRQHLIQLALSYDGSVAGSQLLHRDSYIAAAAVDLYLEKIQTLYPCVVVDYSITSSDVLGYHGRIPWEGQLQDFDSRIQMVSLNGARVQDMITAARNHDLARFQEFQFLFATTLVHEVGAHMLLTFLSNDVNNTPPEISVTGYARAANQGESGRYLELRLFGGTTEYYEDPRQDRHQAGIPYQIDEDGWAWRIQPSVVEDVSQYRFQFPFRLQGERVDPSTMRSLGRTLNDHPTDPQIRYMLARQHPLTPRSLRGYSVRVRDLMAIPRHPERRLVAVA